MYNKTPGQSTKKITMEFDPNNKVVKTCLDAMTLEEKGRTEEAYEQFRKAWTEATFDSEKFISAYFLARHQKNVSDKLEWLKITLQIALKIDDDTVRSAFPALYSNIAKCYEDLGNPEKARQHYEIATSYKYNPSDKGPFYHGTKADLQVGDFLTAGGSSNYKQNLTMNHIYFTALANGAGLAAALAKGDRTERVYIVEPTGPFENDPNVTDKKFPGNPTRSYRSEAPLKIIGELKEWKRLTPEETQKWREKLASNKGEIIN
ncbi:MAG TPA: NAD(+)--rifampin ADP-ribosyltransferase [Rickettsiales bacterium]|nr:NAD(+)--rifampin ADP-ribosyltransferase [Rickettsiales bacterium]